MSGNWGAALAAMLPIFGYMLALVIGFFILWIFAIRFMTHGKIACTFHKNRRKTGGFFKIDPDNNCVWVGRKGDPKAERYNIDPDLIETLEWPGGFPGFMQVTVRSLDYVRFEKDPYPTEEHKGKLSSRSNKFLSDENVLAAVYRHAENSLGLKTNPKLQQIYIFAAAALIGISLFGAYMSMQANNTANKNTATLKAIERTLGVMPSQTPGGK